MIIPPGHFAFFIRFNLVGDPQPMYTHIGFKYDTASGVPATADVDAASGPLHTAFLAELSNTYTMGPHHILVGNDGDPTRVDGTIVSAAGGSGSGSIPQNSAILLKKRGVLAGRANSGRMFVPGVVETLVSDAGAITAAAQTAWTLNGQVFMPAGNVFTAFEAGALELDYPVVFHNASAEAPTEIGSIVCDPIMATQRRRLRR